MTFSIIIPTFNRSKSLVKTLRFIELQVFRDFEVIIVDCSDSSEKLEDSILKSFSFDLIYIDKIAAGNVSQQRNLGLNKANGEYIIFIDDDVKFTSSFLLDYLEVFKESRHEAISGLVETKTYPKGSKPYNSSSVLYDVGDLNYQPCDFEVESHIICTANFGIKKSVIDRYGGFDERMYGILDDVDFGYKLKRSGIKVVHHPGVSVYHYQAKQSGARSLALPNWWKYYNGIYFQLKNLNRNSVKLFMLVFWEEFRPSRSMLNFKDYFSRLVSYFDGFKRALRGFKNYRSEQV